MRKYKGEVHCFSLCKREVELHLTHNYLLNSVFLVNSSLIWNCGLSCPPTSSPNPPTPLPTSSALQLNVTVEKEVAGFWVRVPCVEQLGSCHYQDACALLDELTPPGQDCPPPLSVYQLPCRCPFKKVSPPTFIF